MAGFAGERGNGGDVVVCRDQNGEIISAELLDYYEGRVMRKLPVVEYPGLSDDEFFDMVGEKLNAMEEYNLPFWTNMAKEIMQNIREYQTTGNSSSTEILFTEEDLTDIPDSGELVIKRGCKVEQIAIWLKKTYPEDPTFIFKANLLQYLSQRDVRGLIVHELIYMMLAERNTERRCEMNDSIPVRYYHQKLLSRNVEEFKFPDHLKFVVSTCGAHGFIKTNRMNVRVFYTGNPTDETYNVEAWDLNTEPIRSTQVHLVMNQEGKLDHKLSLERGKFVIRPYGPGAYNGIHPGSLILFHPEEQLWLEHSFLYDPGTFVGFGKGGFKIKLLKSEGQIIPATQWGFMWSGPHNYSNNYTMVLMGATSVAQESPEYWMNFTLDENFNVTFKDIN